MVMGLWKVLWLVSLLVLLLDAFIRIFESRLGNKGNAQR